MTRPVCPYCRAPAAFHASSAIFYTGRDYGPVWACTPCQAWVGCHPGTDQPLGTLADKGLRRARSEAHAAIDQLWKGQRLSRTEAYCWLAQHIGVQRRRCHIGMFNADECARVVEACTERVRKNSSPEK